MPFLNTPHFQHSSPLKTAVLLVNLGTPDAPNSSAVRRYLAQFLADPRVVEIPSFVWKIILHGIILRVRPAKSAKKYASIWTQAGSPLAVYTQAQTLDLRQRLQSQYPDVIVDYAMSYGQPALRQTVDSLVREHNVDQLLIVPLYPQYSATTTASIWDTCFKLFQRLRNPPALRLIKHYHDDQGYIQALAHKVREHWDKHPWPVDHARQLVLTFHGLPQRNLLLGDPYYCECQKTARLLKETLGLKDHEVTVTFQSRFGKATWLQPYTEPTLKTLAKTHARVDVFCPGFTSDCLETLEEIALEAKQAYLEAGGQTFHYIEALNTSTPWMDALEQIVKQNLQGWIQTPQTEQEQTQILQLRNQMMVDAKQKLGLDQHR